MKQRKGCPICGHMKIHFHNMGPYVEAHCAKCKRVFDAREVFAGKLQEGSAAWLRENGYKNSLEWQQERDYGPPTVLRHYANGRPYRHRLQ